MPHRLPITSHLQEAPRFKAFGVGQIPKPRLLTCQAPAAPHAGVAAATISITGTCYHEGLSQLTADQWSAWFHWLGAERPEPLFKKAGAKITPGDNTGRQEQEAAEVMITYAVVEEETP